MGRASDVGLKFNKQKSSFHQKEIKFIGRIFNEKGAQPDRNKIQSIVEMLKLNSVVDLQTLVNYLTFYISKGCCFTRKNPVAYASASLTSAQINYA